MRKAGLIPGLLMLGILVAACGSKGTNSNTQEQVPGDPDAGTTTPPPPPLQVGEFTHYTEAQGLPPFVAGSAKRIYDVSGDEAGNIWVAAYDGLFVLRSGAASFEKLTKDNGLKEYNIISVAGLGPGEAMVGYEGQFGQMEDNDPEPMLKSGGASRVTLTDSGISATHYLMETPGIVPKIRSVYVIRPVFGGTYAGDVWFGGNHGVAMWNQAAGRIIEHQTVAITPNGSFLDGDFFGLAFDAAGDVWIGGAHRSGKIAYATSGGDFFAAIDPVLDVWPDADELNRTEDHIKALAVDASGNVWFGSLVNGLQRHVLGGGGCEPVAVGPGMGKGITALAADPDGTIWVGSWSGLGRYDPEADSWNVIRHMGSGLPTDEIMSLQIDTRTTPRTLYIGTLKGISVYKGE